MDTLSALCAENHISAYKLCEKIGLNRSAVAKWKKGSLPNGTNLNKIATYFGVSTDYLMGNEQKERPVRGSVQVRDEHDNIMFLDDETRDIVNGLRSRPEMKMLFSVSKGATPEDIIKTVKIIEALKDKGEGDR